MDHLQLLRELKVKRIYWVDDHNATIEDLDLTQLTELLIDRLVSESIEDINICIKTFKEREPKVTRRAAKAIQDARTRQEQENVDPTSSIKDAVEKMIESLSTTISPSELVNDALRAFPTRFTESEKKTLAEAFMAKGDWEWFPISFTDWSKRHADILGDHNTLENAALLIVDLQNDREKTSVDGKGVLENWAHWVTSSNSMRSVFAIAFTDRFRPEDEIKEGRNYTNNLFTAPLKQQLPVLVLSKARLKSDHNRGSGAQEAFKRALGRLRACLLHWDLASDLEGLFSQSVADAFKDLQELSIEELLMGVSGGHTLQEGASDVDTLIRLAAIAQRGALLSRIADNENTAKILLELRGLAEIFKDYGSANLADRAGIAKLRASEVHDPASVVNKLFSPLSTGDVFEINRYGADEYYMLASNICDLTIRGTTGKRKIETGLLLRIARTDTGTDAESKPYKVLPRFPNGSPLAEGWWQVEYNVFLTAPTEILDLAWTNVDGTCAWSETLALPPHLAPSQQLRFTALKAKLATHDLRKKIAQALPGITMSDEQSAHDIAQVGKIDFSARRVGRISQAYATAISEGFGQNISRPSFDHDISGG